jgi:preprotein translocase SecE subunit
MNLLSYLKHVRAEMAHVVWPDARTAIGHTLILIGIGAFTAIFIGLLDYGFTQLASTVISTY